MAKVEVKNIVVGYISPKNDVTKDMNGRDAFEKMMELVKDLMYRGWSIFDIFDNEKAKGFIMKIIDKNDCELSVSVHIRKF